MLRLPPTKIHVTQRELRNFRPKHNDQHIGVPQEDRHQNFQNIEIELAPQIRRGPSRSRDASVVYRQMRRHQAFSVGSSESDTVSFESAGHSYQRTNDILTSSEEEINVTDTNFLEVQEDSLFVKSFDHSAGLSIELGTAKSDEDHWPSLRPVLEPHYSDAVVCQNYCDLAMTSDHSDSVKEQCENVMQQSFWSQRRTTQQARHRSRSEPPESCLATPEPLHATMQPRDYLFDLRQELLNMSGPSSRPRRSNNDHYILLQEPALTPSTGISAHLQRESFEFSDARHDSRSRHSRHESWPICPSTSFSSPIRGFQHGAHVQRQREESELDRFHALNHMHSPLEELVYEARARLSQLGLTETRIRNWSSETHPVQDGDQLSEFAGPPTSPTLVTASPLNSPRLSEPSSRAPSKIAAEFLLEDTAREARPVQRLTFRPRPSLTRHRSRTPVWQAGTRPFLMEDVIRSGQARRGTPSMEQENEEDMSRYSQQRQIWTWRQGLGGVLEGTPPHETQLESLQR